MDNRQRPVVFETRSEPGEHRQRRKPTRVLMWISLVLLGAAACCGLAEGGSAVWSVLGPGGHSNNPAPLWVNPPTIALHRQDDGPPAGNPGTKAPALLNHSTQEHSSLSTTVVGQPQATTHVESGDPDHGGSTATTGGSTNHGSTGTGSTGTGGVSGSSVTGSGSSSGSSSSGSSSRGGGTSRGGSTAGAVESGSGRSASTGRG